MESGVTKMRIRAVRFRAVAGASTLLAALAATTATTQAQEPPPSAQMMAQAANTRTFNIPPQPLASALPMFGQQSGRQITADAALVRGVSTPGVQGTMTIDAADRSRTGAGRPRPGAGDDRQYPGRPMPAARSRPVASSACSAIAMSWTRPSTRRATRRRRRRTSRPRRSRRADRRSVGAHDLRRRHGRPTIRSTSAASPSGRHVLLWRSLRHVTDLLGHGGIGGAGRGAEGTERDAERHAAGDRDRRYDQYRSQARARPRT
jgi:hypothetical protein